MWHYWKINKRIFYTFVVIACVIFLISFVHLKKSKQPLPSQLLFNAQVSFGIIGAIYLALFLVSYNKFKEIKRFFEGPLFASLPPAYQVIETRPSFMVFLAGLTIRGQSKGYPVRIEYEKRKIIIVIGVETDKENMREVQSTLAEQGLTIDYIGVIKELKQEDINSSKTDLNQIIEETTAYLKQINLKPLSNY